MTDRKYTLAGGFKKLHQIATGWLRAWGFLETNDEMQVLSKNRLSICEQCKHAKYNKLIHILNGAVHNVNTLECTLCHCPVLEKSLAKGEYCPINKW